MTMMSETHNKKILWNINI